jgi:hypothetical protein
MLKQKSNVQDLTLSCAYLKHYWLNIYWSEKYIQTNFPVSGSVEN